MANDERPSEEQEEREFLVGLKARTGRDLSEWMAAIAAQGFQDKNEIIDWLRTQGLPFARASWLERIHRNGGKPIHAGSLPAPAVDARPAASPPRLVVVAPVPRPAPLPVQPTPPPQPAPPPPPVQVAPTPAPAPVQPAAPVEPGVSPGLRRGAESDPDRPEAAPKPAKKAPKPPPLIEAPADAAALENLVATAKGYRPLYHHLEAQIRRAIPAAVVAARDRYVAIGAPLEFAAVTLHPTEIRLGLALGDRPFDARLQPAKLRGPGAGITHMVVLTDARQVNDDLLALLQAANTRVNASD